MRRNVLLVGVVVAAGLVAAAPALGSQIVARNAKDVRLRVSPDGGRALVTYRSRGKAGHVAASGAINALAPSPDRPQVRFRLRYSASVGFRDACRLYDGPALRWLVAACRAPDGSYWALQQWQRLLPIRGQQPTARQQVWELRLSHWSGPVAELSIDLDWAYRRYDELYGRLTYRGVPVHGFHSTHRGAPLDDYGRNIFVDTLDSAYGPGWRRENGFLTHRPTGAFCYGFFPRSDGVTGQGRAYRATVAGPGVTPDVSWSSPAPGPFDAARDLQAATERRDLFAASDPCRAANASASGTPTGHARPSVLQSM